MVSDRVRNSYVARYSLEGRGSAPIVDLTDAVDVHVHCPGNAAEEPFNAAMDASRASMKALVFKTIGPGGPPMQLIKAVQEQVNRQAEAEGLRPVECIGAIGTNSFAGGIDLERIRKGIAAGAKAMWMPSVTASHSLLKVGGRGSWFTTNPRAGVVGPVPWDDAVLNGIYVLENGKLKPDVREALRLAAQNNMSFSFGHLSRPEMYEMAAEVGKLGFEHAFIDHPLSEILEFSADELKEFTAAGLHVNFTYDEISPLLGVDPTKMVEVIQSVGVEHCTVSSDAGTPLLPSSVEALRLLMTFLLSYGLSAAELRTMAVENPTKVVAVGGN
jgi:hypothetical protein